MSFHDEVSSRSLRLSNERLSQARESFKRTGLTQSQFVLRLVEKHHRTITVQPLRRFLRGEPIDRENFKIFCEALKLDLGEVLETQIPDRDLLLQSSLPIIQKLSTLDDKFWKPRLLNYIDEMSAELEITVCHIHNTEELRKSRQIAESVFGEDMIPFSIEYSWWEAFEFGYKALYCGDEMVGVLTIHPVEDESANQFSNGQIMTEKLSIKTVASCQEQPCSIWYASGLFLKDIFRRSKRNPIYQLLSIGMNMWMESPYVTFPVKILALAVSNEGEKILERFSFIRAKEGPQMAGGYPLYILKLSSKSDLLSLIRRRHLN
ncbi:MAG: hypothetical protein WCA07_14025 [Gloeobacterales cyanobacterium]